MGTNLADYAYVAWHVRLGNFPKGIGVRYFPVPISVEIQRTRCRGSTVCAKYTYIYPSQNFIRVLKVRNGTWGQTIY